MERARSHRPSGGYGRLAGAVCILSIGLSGCTVVDVPEHPRGVPASWISPNARTRPATYDDGIVYLQAARGALLRKSRQYQVVDTVTKAGVAIGVAGAGTASAFAAPAKPIAGFLSFGAVNFAANRDVAPGALIPVYRAGLANLDCIQAAAVAAKAGIDAITSEMRADADSAPAQERFETLAPPAAGVDRLPGSDLAVVHRVNEAIRALRRDIAEATDGIAGGRAPDHPELYQAAIGSATEAIATARSVLREISALMEDDALGEKIVAGVDATLAAVNQNALKRSPSVDAILQSGSAFASFFKAGAGWAGAIQTSQAQLRGISTASGDALVARFRVDEMRLHAAVALVPSLAVDARIASVGQCRTEIGVLVPVGVSPNPVTLTAGGDPAKLAVTGVPPFTIMWKGDAAPDGVSYEGTGASPSLSATDKAAPGTSSFHLTDSFGTSSPDVALTVTAEAAAIPSAVNPPATGTPEAARPVIAPGGPDAGPGGK